MMLSILFLLCLLFSFKALMELIETIELGVNKTQWHALISMILWALFYHFSKNQ